MTEQPRSTIPVAIPQYRKEIRQETLKTVAKMLSDFYRSNQKPITPQELKEKTFTQVKEMDYVAGSKATSENEYKQIMHNLLLQFQQKLSQHSQQQEEQMDPLMMATIMINSLPELRSFMEQTEFIGPHDLSLLRQLIQFIESIPVTQFGPQIAQSDQIQTVKLYYERLFFPIKQTIRKQTAANAANNGMNAQNSSSSTTSLMMSPQYSPMPLSLPPTTASSIAGTMQNNSGSLNQQTLSISSNMHNIDQHRMPSPMQLQQQQSHVPHQTRSPQQKLSNSPASRSNSRNSQQQLTASQSASHNNVNEMSPQRKTSNQTQPQSQIPQSQLQQNLPQGRALSGEQLIKQLFVNIRTDCAVFYSTPHPPHF
ncbi:hypothetical protein TRFO_08019 [Tritrichomonas foetus]|uniref:Uncharacterized protein n=1 Tax=Tritrichomonas foetus TaxID=1144522 RepID=A0A1J4JMP9_9EUKA|nr:hypothetical protein TRFO_08019 [Tritrichomonas foetus]|eukprot:OHT00347.1 hypothetical protein TRFO_08019 [Tritrichomonas foetus]